MRAVLIVAAVAAGLYGLHCLARWAERRGWIYYRERRGNSDALGNALLQVHSLLEPAQRYVVEALRQERHDDDESGDPPAGVPGGELPTPLSR
jgi:hypothetical protein